MPNDLRHALEKAALEGGRPLTSEINRRLANSLLDEGLRPPRHGAIYAMADAAYRVSEPDPSGKTVLLDEAHHSKGGAGVGEALLLEVFRRLPAEKQLALLALLK